MIAFAGFRAFKTVESVFPGLPDPSISRHFPHKDCVHALVRSNDPEQSLEIPMSWTRRSDRGQGRPHRLRFEPLEQRTLLAVAAFQINLHEDVGGAPGELITDDVIEPNDTFFVEIVAREYHPYAYGLGRVALDITWDPDVLEEIDEDVQDTITSNLPEFRTGDLDNENGEITDLGGSALVSLGAGRPIGNLVTEQFALLHFRALGPADDSSITMCQGMSRITTAPVSSLSSEHLDFETQTIHVVSPSSPSLVEEVLPEHSVPVASTPATESSASLETSSVTQPVLATATTDEGPLVGLALNLYEDAGGTPGDAITDGEVEIGESYYVQITAEDLRDAPLGIGGLSVDVSWDPDVFREIDLPFEPASLVTEDLPLYQSGTLDQDAGQIDDLGGVSLRSMAKGQPIGAGGSEQFALLHFTAVGVADSSIISLAIGSSGVGVVEGTVDSPDDVLIQSTSISVVKLVAPPQIKVTATSGPDLESVQFGTQLEGTVSPLVRPSLPDTAQYVEVTNTGPSPLTIDAIQINVPDVTVAGSTSGVVLQAGETERLRLEYAPTTPNVQNKTAQSFQAENGLVIVSDAENAPRVEIALTGHSTFDADITYDGNVNIADLVSFDDHCGARSGDANYHPSIDPNGDGSVDLGDFGPLNVYYRQSRPSVDTPVRAASRATDEALLGVVEDEPAASISEMDELAAAVAAAWPNGDDDRDETTDSMQGPALPDFMLWE